MCINDRHKYLTCKSDNTIKLAKTEQNETLEEKKKKKLF